MRKNLVLAALAVVALASCSNEEILEVNKGEAISFRTIVNGNTRATPTSGDITTANIEDFNVYAMKGGTTTAYFENVDYSKQDGTFTSTNKYYWPATGTLDFYAYAPKSGTGIARDGYNTWTVTQQTTPSAPDFIVAKNSGDKAHDAAGLSLNFRHAMSKISVKVKNSNTGMYMKVTDWKIAYIYDKGTFTLGESTMTNNSATLAGTWAFTGATQAVAKEVSNGALTSAVTIDAGASVASVDNFKDFIVIPQAMKAATGSDLPTYAGENAGDKWANTFIAVKMAIYNDKDKTSSADGTLLAAEQWCCWPITTTWAPGMHYTYVIDLAGGGYQESNDGLDEDPETDGTQSTTALDPVLKEAEIKFVSVTVDAWKDATDITVSGPTK